MALKINEELKKQLGESIVKSLEEAAKDTDLFIGSGNNYIPQSRFDEVNNQAKDYKAKYEASNADLEKLKPLAAGNEALTKQITDLQAANTKSQQEFSEKLAAREKDFLLSDALREAKAKNPKAVMALLDQSKLTIKDGKLEGLKEQVDSLIKSEAYLFDVTTQPSGPKLDHFGNPITGDGSGGVKTPEQQAEEIASSFGFAAPAPTTK